MGFLVLKVNQNIIEERGNGNEYKQEINFALEVIFDINWYFISILFNKLLNE